MDLCNGADRIDQIRMGLGAWRLGLSWLWPVPWYGGQGQAQGAGGLR